MIHTFDTDVAKEYGVNCAIILQNLYYWVEKNRANERHFYDGRYWTYNSVKAFEELFPYLSGKQIRSALNKLVDEGIIVDGYYNDSAYDRTKWYAITEKGMCFFQKRQTDLPSEANGDPEKGKCINIYNNNIDTTTDINTNIKQTYGHDREDSLSDHDDEKPKKKDVDEFFAEIWKAYPKKKGKGAVSDAKKRKLYEEVGLEQMLRCIDRYKNDSVGTSEQYVMYGSTFFNSGYVDYLDDNYGEQGADVEDNLPFM